jgi:uncharacterized membrane protein YidH (DUF202 family)
LPGRYTAFNFELAGAGITVGILTALLSGKRFADADQRERRKAAMTLARPVVLCTFILFVFCVIGVLNGMHKR